MAKWRVWSLGFGLGFRFEVLGFRVAGLECRVMFRA